MYVPKVLKTGNKYEVKEDLCGLVKALSKSVKFEIIDSDIRDIYRVSSKKETNKPIIVELNSVILKDKLLQAVKVFNKTKPRDEKLNTRHLHVQGPAKPVFISESLTLKAQRLFFLAREFARDNDYAFCWTSKGYVYLRKAENMPLLRSDRDEDLLKVQTTK